MAGARRRAPGVDARQADATPFEVSGVAHAGLLTDIAAKVEQEIRPGEKLAVIEAMKMQNILKAENDCVVAEVMAKPGDSLFVGRPIMKFR